MIRTEPIRFNLREYERLIFRPYEDARFEITFDGYQNLNGWTFRMWAEQDPWPPAARPFTVFEPRYWGPDSTVFHVNGNTLEVTIPAADMATWVDILAEMQLNANDGNREWCAADFKINVARGE